VVGFDEAAAAGMLEKLKVAQKAAPVRGEQRRKRVTAEWKAAMQASWSGVVPRPAVPWQCGVVDVGVRAKWPTLFCSLEGVRCTSRAARRGDCGGAMLARMGSILISGWEATLLREIASVTFDDEAGLPSLAVSGVPITLGTVDGLGLGPAMQMLCRARLMMPAEV
jgi:hypothetical protein